MKNLTVISISVVIGVVLYAALFALGDIDRTSEILVSFSPLDWAVVLGLSLVNYTVRFLRFEKYIALVSHIVPGSLRHFLIYLGGFALTTTPGKAGELIRSIYLRVDSVPIAASLSAFAMERIMDLLVIALLAALIVQGHGQFQWTAPAVLAGVLLLVVLIHKEPVVDWMHRRADRHSGRLRDVARNVANTLSNAKKLLQPRIAAGGIAAGVFAWGCEGVALAYILNALGADLSVTQAVGTYGLAMLLGAISFVPGGLGSTEIVMSLVLAGQGVPLEVAIAATVVCRIATLWFAVFLGVMALLILARKYPGAADSATTP